MEQNLANLEADGTEHTLKGVPCSADAKNLSVMNETNEQYIDRMTATATKLAISPLAQAAESMACHHPFQSYLDLRAVETILNADMQAVVEARDFEALEKMLFAQTLTLNNLFHVAIQKAADKPEHFKPHIDLALRLQKQARSTAELLHRLKYPPAPLIRNTAEQMLVQTMVNHPANKLSDRENGYGSDLD